MSLEVGTATKTSAERELGGRAPGREGATRSARHFEDPREFTISRRGRKRVTSGNWLPTRIGRGHEATDEQAAPWRDGRQRGGSAPRGNRSTSLPVAR